MNTKENTLGQFPERLPFSLDIPYLIRVRERIERAGISREDLGDLLRTMNEDGAGLSEEDRRQVLLCAVAMYFVPEPEKPIVFVRKATPEEKQAARELKERLGLKF